MRLISAWKTDMDFLKYLDRVTERARPFSYLYKVLYGMIFQENFKIKKNLV
jgi:hypothetical protein